MSLDLCVLLRGQAKKSHRVKEIWLVSLPLRIRNGSTAGKCDHHLEIGNGRELRHGNALRSIDKKILMTPPPPKPSPPFFDLRSSLEVVCCTKMDKYEV